MNKTLAGVGWFFFGCFLVSLFKGVTLPGAILAVSSATCLSAAYRDVRYAYIALIGFVILGSFMAYRTVTDSYYGRGYQDAVLKNTNDQQISEVMSNAVNIPVPIKKEKTDVEQEAEYRDFFEAAIKEKPELAIPVLRQCLYSYLSKAGSVSNGRVYEHDFLSLKMSNPKDMEGNANFSMKIRNGLQNPTMITRVDGSLTYTLKRLKPWEDKDDCAPDHYPYRVEFSNFHVE